ncbi:hypothetical protein Sru01_46670 [Sphaerisporangium rufum]|uniref:Uncharacterized protein n=1 Tax=Sphaerisporangium rufum TaxID=1381558 RepID=A0A919R9A3_9ACTN|nr:hypothetical protein Sru01_46670 [Sphaerisporangium rufum]
MLLGAAGVGTVAAAGGLAEGPPERPPRPPAGAEIDQDVFRTRVRDAVVHLAAEDSGAPRNAVLDVTFSVYNDARSSVPLDYLERSLLRVAAPGGERLLDAGRRWEHLMSVPGEGGASTQLPPRRTSTVLLRIKAPGTEPVPAGAYPARLDIDFGRYENHEDFLTGRHRAELVTGDDERPLVAAQVAVPVRKAG